MNPETLLFALGTTISVVLSLGAAGFSLAAWLRPARDLERLRAKVHDLSGLRVEWENVQASLDSLNKRAARLQRIEAGREAAVAAVPVDDGRRRMLSLSELKGVTNAR